MKYRMIDERYQTDGIAEFDSMDEVNAELDAQHVTDIEARQAYIDALEEVDE